MQRTTTLLIAFVLLALLAFGFLGVTNSVHLAAKIVYAVVIAATSAGLTRLALKR